MGKHIHRLSELDPEARTAVCANCGPVKVKSDGHNRWRCGPAATRKELDRRQKPEHKEKYAAWHAEYYIRTGGVAQRRATLRGYNMTIEEYEEKKEAQDGVCMTCRKPCPTGKNLAVDHCHKTNLNRDLLCLNCNRSLGINGEDPEVLIAQAEYLLKWRDLHAEALRNPAHPTARRTGRAPRVPIVEKKIPTLCKAVCRRNHPLITRNAIVTDRGPDTEPKRECRACISGMKKVGRYAKRGITLDPDKTCDEMLAVIMGEAPRPKAGRPKGSKNKAPAESVPQGTVQRRRPDQDGGGNRLVCPGRVFATCTGLPNRLAEGDESTVLHCYRWCSSEGRVDQAEQRGVPVVASRS